MTERPTRGRRTRCAAAPMCKRLTCGDVADGASRGSPDGHMGQTPSQGWVSPESERSFSVGRSATDLTTLLKVVYAGQGVREIFQPVNLSLKDICQSHMVIYEVLTVSSPPPSVLRAGIGPRVCRSGSRTTVSRGSGQGRPVELRARVPRCGLSVPGRSVRVVCPVLPSYSHPCARGAPGACRVCRDSPAPTASRVRLISR